MSTSIFVESNELRQAAMRTGQIINSMQNIRQAIARIQNSKTGTWQGQASTRNTSNFNALGEMIGSYLNSATATKQVLDEAVTYYTETEQAEIRNVQQLSTEGIF